MPLAICKVRKDSGYKYRFYGNDVVDVEIKCVPL